MSRARGALHPNAKLTEDDVALIRRSKMGPSELARKLGVSKATISQIRAGKLWAPELPKNGEGTASSGNPALVEAPPVGVGPAGARAGFPSSNTQYARQTVELEEAATEDDTVENVPL